MAKDKNIVAHALYLSLNEQNDLALAGRKKGLSLEEERLPKRVRARKTETPGGRA